MLRVQMPVALGDLTTVSAPTPRQNCDSHKGTHRVGADLAVLLALVHLVLLGARDVDHAVDNDVGDVHAPRPKLPRQALRQAPDGKLARRKGPEAGRAAHRGRRARDDQGRRVRGRGHGFEQGGEGRLREVEEAEAGAIC